MKQAPRAGRDEPRVSERPGDGKVSACALGLNLAVESCEAAARGPSQGRAVPSQLDLRPACLSTQRREAIDPPVRPQVLHDVVIVVGEREHAMGSEVRLALRESPAKDADHGIWKRVMTAANGWR